MQERTITFDPVPHTYTDETGQEYISATTIIGKYKKPFDRAYWSMYKALQANGYKVRPANVEQRTMSISGLVYSVEELYTDPLPMNTKPKDLTDQWEILTELACNVGSDKHDFLENSINEAKIGGDVTNEFIRPFKFKNRLTMEDLNRLGLKTKHPKIFRWLTRYINDGWTLYAEKVVYTSIHFVSGMIDVLAVKGKSFAILDWKTNKDEIKFESGYFKKENGIPTDRWISLNKTMLHPISHIPESKGYTYALQLSLYAYIMELWGYQYVGLQLCHIRGIPGILDEKRFEDRDKYTVVIEMPYLRSEIESVFNARLETLTNG